MVRGFVQEHVYKHPWERVTAANWRKYSDPEHKSQLSHVLEVDTIDRKLDSEAGQLHCTRVITVNAPGPWWLQRVLGGSVCHCLENSTVDGKNRTMEMVTRNVTMKDFVEVEERCSYLPHPENPDWTVFKQETNIRCATLSVLATMAERIEQRCVENFQKNSFRGREVMERVCSFMEKESASI
ncbi:hypothetical protein Mapa_005564 [Marchantia paleacea]|nr:hypothetical protein Mapa_005564 [Marchantia paleacea]